MPLEIPDSFLAPVRLDPRWETSRFKSIKLLPPKQKGKRLEELAEWLLTQHGHIVSKPNNTDHDRIVNGMKTEIKGSTVNLNTDNGFSFMQIRKDDDYEQMLFITISWDCVSIWTMDKNTINEYITDGTFPRQHGGAKKDSNTYCYLGSLENLRANRIITAC